MLFYNRILLLRIFTLLLPLIMLADPVEVIEFNDDYGIPVIEINLEGENYRFLWDTGAASVMSYELSSRLKLNPHRKEIVMDAHLEERSLEFVEYDGLRIGQLVFDKSEFALSNLKSSFVFGCLGLDGILGANTLRQYKWTIDYQLKRLTVVDRIDKNNFDFETKFSTDNYGIPRLTISKDHKKIRSVVLDTGFTGGIHCSTSHLDLKKSMLKSVGSASYSLFGQRKVDTVYFQLSDYFKLGKTKLDAQLLAYEEGGEQLMGVGFLSQFQMAMDWSKKKIYWKRVKKQTLMPPSVKLHVDDTGVSIGALVQGSSADQSGLVLFDRLLSVNGVSTDSMTTSEKCFLLTKRHADMELLVAKKNKPLLVALKATPLGQY